MTKDKLEYDEGGRIWTDWCYRFFKQLGEQNELRTFNSGNLGEYLWDLIWSDSSENTLYPQQIVMAMEVEWGHYLDDIMHDFYKLLQCKVALKIFLCICLK